MIGHSLSENHCAANIDPEIIYARQQLLRYAADARQAQCSIMPTQILYNVQLT